MLAFLLIIGMKVGLGPGNIVLDGDPAVPTEWGTATTPPLFGPCLLRPNGPISATERTCLTGSVVVNGLAYVVLRDM